MQPVLYQNLEGDITLIDIPTSIAAAQGRTDALLSYAPPEQPYASNDPKTPAKQAQLAAQHAFDEELHAIYAPIISKALADIRSHLSGKWCSPRQALHRVRRARHESDMEVENDETVLDRNLQVLSNSAENELEGLHVMMPSLTLSTGDNSSNGSKHSWTVCYSVVEDDHSTGDLHMGSEDDTEMEADLYPWSSSCYNAQDKPMKMTVQPTSTKSASGYDCVKFQVPPRSSFFLYDCHQMDKLRSAFRSITEEYTLPRHFDFVLLDPPWPNRSARRKGAYTTQRSPKELKQMILRMDLDNYIENSGLIGIWVTNKPSIRSLVLGPHGIFERLNVGLIEEWIWIKTTVHGEPITSMDSVWRKPYETLLLGRAAPNAWTVAQPATEVRRRVIAAVPDLHSRKPCLKQLVEPMMPDPDDYSALEIFSRHLVAGWCSWGNEVLKFNWDGYWTKEDASEGARKRSDEQLDAERDE